MNIQEASEDVTKGGILFPSFKTSYIEENTKTGKEKWHFSTGFALKRLGASKKRLGTWEKRLVYGLKRPGLWKKHGAHSNL